MTIRAHDDTPDRPSSPPDREDIREMEIEKLASEIELELDDSSWLQAFLEGIEDACWLLPPNTVQSRLTDGVKEAGTRRHKNLRALRANVQAHQYEQIGRILVQMFRERLVTKAHEELL